MKFHGSYVALVTPFNADGSIDFGKLKELIFCIIKIQALSIRTF